MPIKRVTKRAPETLSRVGKDVVHGLKEAAAQAPLVLRGDYSDSIRKAAQMLLVAANPLNQADPHFLYFVGQDALVALVCASLIWIGHAA